MKAMKKLASLLLALTMTCSLAACGQKTSGADTQQPDTSAGDTAQTEKSKIDQIKEAGVLVMGTSADYPPNEFHTMVDGKDTIVGFDVSLAQYIADDLGVELKVVDMAFDGLCISLSKGDFDIVISGMASTPERKESVDFSAPYFLQKQAVLLRAEDADNYNTTDDLAGHKVGVQNGTIQVPIVNELVGEDNTVGLVKAQDLVMELKSGKIDVVCIDYTPSLAFASANDDLVMKDIGIPSSSDGQCIGVQKGNDDFVEYLNGIVEKVLADGTMEQFIADAQLLAGVEE